jgi:hypothetical protein
MGPSFSLSLHPLRRWNSQAGIGSLQLKESKFHTPRDDKMNLLPTSHDLIFVAMQKCVEPTMQSFATFAPGLILIFKN